MNKIKASMDNLGPQRSSEDNLFWAEVISNKWMSWKLVDIAPNSLSPKTFINRIRGSITPGRLLIAIPGGFNTTLPIVVYAATLQYDVGHVAIMNAYAPTTEYTSAKFTRSTNNVDNMHDEVLNVDWCPLHGVSFVGQVFDYKWVWYYRNWHSWGYNYQQVDVDNNAMVLKVNSLVDIPYVHVWEIPYAKWVAPDRFTCTSTAWWCAKQACGVNITDWYNPTILPAGVYLSDRVRIIDDTMW